MSEKTTVQDTAAIDTENLSNAELDNLMFGDEKKSDNAENPVEEKTETTEGSSPAGTPAVKEEGSEQQPEPENPAVEETPAETQSGEQKPAEQTVPVEVLVKERKKYQERLRTLESKYQIIKNQTVAMRPVELTESEKVYYEKQREIDPDGADLWRQATVDGKRQNNIAIEGIQIARKMETQQQTEAEMTEAAIELYPELADPNSELNKKAWEYYEDLKPTTGDSIAVKIKAIKMAADYVEAKRSASSNAVSGQKSLAARSRPMTGGGSLTSRPTKESELVDRVSRELYGD